MHWTINKLVVFRDDTSGATTVEFVVLTAAIIGLGIAVATSIGAGATEASGDTKTCLRSLGNKVTNDNLSYQVALRRAARRCQRL